MSWRGTLVKRKLEIQHHLCSLAAIYLLMTSPCSFVIIFYCTSQLNVSEKQLFNSKDFKNTVFLSQGHDI